MRPAVAERLRLTASVLQAFVQNRGLKPLGEKDLSTYAWKIMGRQAVVSLAFKAIELTVLVCCAVAGATLLGMDPVRGTAALLVVRFLLVGVSVKKSAEVTQRRVLTATLEEACTKTTQDPNAPQSITEALLRSLDLKVKEQKPGEKN